MTDIGDVGSSSHRAHAVNEIVQVRGRQKDRRLTCNCCVLQWDLSVTEELRRARFRPVQTEEDYFWTKFVLLAYSSEKNELELGRDVEFQS